MSTEMDWIDVMLRVLIGVVFGFYGVFLIRRKKVEFGFGGRLPASPIANIYIEGVAAVFFGFFLTFGGLIFALSFVFYWLGDVFSSSLLGNISTYSLFVMFVGLIISPLIPSKRLTVTSKLLDNGTENGKSDN
jgi:hypothetical protein